VGGVPTMIVNDKACCVVQRGALSSIASKLAPTGCCVIPNLSRDSRPVGAGLPAMAAERATQGSRSHRLQAKIVAVLVAKPLKQKKRPSQAAKCVFNR